MNNNALNQWFSQPDALGLLFLLPILTVLSIVAARRRRKVLTRMGRLPALAALVERRRQWPSLRLFCMTTSLSILAFAIAGPQWGREPQVPLAYGRDLVVVLDMSRSMLADDVLPNRLERAQEAVEELVANLKQRGGHRLALVAFAGRARVFCPLTNDYDHFLERLLELDGLHPPPELRAGPDAVSGTRIGDALRLAVEAHDARFRGEKVQDILLLSDGDDPAADNEWTDGITAAQAAGIPVYTVGIGDVKEGRPIPAGERGYLKFQGKLVQSKLMDRPLKEIAEQTHGTYTAAGIAPVPLVDLFRRQIESGRKREAVDEAPPVYRQRSSWFFGAALLLLTLEMITGRTFGSKTQAPKPKQIPVTKEENPKRPPPP